MISLKGTLNTLRISSRPRIPMIFLKDSLTFLKDSLIFLKDSLIFLKDSLIFLTYRHTCPGG